MKNETRSELTDLFWLFSYPVLGRLLAVYQVSFLSLTQWTTLKMCRFCVCILTPPQRNSQSVLFSCSLPPARFDLISPAWGQFQASAGFLGARCLATRRFQNGGCSFKIQPHSLTFTKISHHSSHLLIFGMLSPV